jgi:hypothetical protein
VKRPMASSLGRSENRIDQFSSLEGVGGNKVGFRQMPSGTPGQGELVPVLGSTSEVNGKWTGPSTGPQLRRGSMWRALGITVAG